MTDEERWQALFEKVQRIVADNLGVEIDAVSRSAALVDDLGADSLDAVEIVMAIEEEFGIEIPDDAAEKILRVGEAVDYLCGQGVKP